MAVVSSFTLFALIKDELTSIDAGSSSNPLTGNVGLKPYAKPCIRKKSHWICDWWWQRISWPWRAATCVSGTSLINGTSVAEIHGKIETIGGYTIGSTSSRITWWPWFSPRATWNLTQFSRLAHAPELSVLYVAATVATDEPTNHLDRQML